MFASQAGGGQGASVEDDSQDLGPMAALADVGPPESRRPRRSNRGWFAAAIAVVAVLAVTLGVIALVADDDRSSARPGPHVLTTPAARAVLSALDASTSAGGYEVSYDFVITPGHTRSCVPQTGVADGNGTGSVTTMVGGSSSLARTSSCSASDQPVTVSGHGQVGLDPYFLQTTSTVTGLGEVTVRTDGTKIAEQGGANYGGSLEDGQPLSGFAPAVQSTFGDGPGALTMLGLASPTGYLSLSADAVTGVTPAGTGMVGDTPVTYYDVVSDPDAMRQLPALTDEQLKTVDEALKVLHRSGFVEAKSRIAVDAAGYVRESSSTASFADGTTMTRHMTLSRFGCIGTGPTPANPSGAPAPLTGDCVTPSTTAPSTVPTTVPSAPSSTVSSSSTTLGAETTTTSSEATTTTSTSTP